VDTISGTPTAAVVSGSITVTAANGVLPDATQTFTITINQATTITAITSDTPDPSVYGAAVPVNFTVTGQFGNTPTAPTGNVTITDDASAATCTGTVAAGTCNITFTVLGAHNLTATYVGDANFTGSASAVEAHTVNQAATTTTITSDAPDPSDVGSAITINYSVAVVAPATGTPTGTVTITDSASAATCNAPIVAGGCSIMFTTVGPRNLTATYSGDTEFAGSVSPLEAHIVNPIGATVTTNAATGMNTTSAILHATVNANYDSTAVTFEYGLTTAYGSVVAGVPSPVTGNTNTAVSAPITGLTPNTLYHFRAIGLNGAGTTYGGDLTFSTNPIVYPTVASSNPANNAVLTAGPTQLIVNFNKDVVHDGSANAADNTANYLLVGVGANSVFNTLTCLGGVGGDDVNFVINTAVYNNNGGAGPFQATLGINGAIPLPVGTYRLFVCGSTSIRDDEGYILNNGVDGQVTFTVQAAPLPAALPATGFTPNRVTVLPTQPADKAYAALSSLWMEIPSLSVKMNIVGIPQTKGSWDVSWLGSQAGWLQGTAFPTWVGNSVVTAHVTDANGKNGPFAGLKNLMYGDRIIIHMNGQKYTYEVRAMKSLTPTDTSYVFQPLAKYSYLTLLTCKGYNPLTDQYAYREVVRAVLISITADK
jgi:LPXTG-site transpeptidase (sortase) family protein